METAIQREANGWYCDHDVLSGCKWCATIFPRASGLRPRVSRVRQSEVYAPFKSIDQTNIVVIDSSRKSLNGTRTIKLGKYMPLTVKINPDKSIKMVSEHAATHMLIGAEPCEAGISVDTEFVMWYGSVVTVVTYKSGGIARYYWNIDYPTSLMNDHQLAYASAIISGHPVRAYEPSSRNNLFDVIDKTLIRNDCNVHYDSTCLRSLPRSKISVGHHYNYRAYSVYDAFNDEEKEVAALAFTLPPGVEDSMMAGVMIWLNALDVVQLKFILESGLLRCVSIEAFKKLGKAISVRAKSMAKFCDMSCTNLFEIDVLVNRMDGDVDWDSEKEHRVNPRLANVDPRMVYKKAMQIFAHGRVDKPKYLGITKKQFVKMRWQWTPAGSFYSQYKEDEEYRAPTWDMNNKLFAVSRMSALHVNKMLDREPAMSATTSTKYEWGKTRAIYGCDITSFMQATFGFWKAEETLPVYFPVGQNSDNAAVARAVGGTIAGKTPFCFDFEDFNSQHSTEAMQSVLMAWRDTYSGEMTSEQAAACDWVISSLDNVTVNVIKSGQKVDSYKLAGTLLSGWRLTSFVNTVLNKIYCMHLTEDDDTIKSVHNGDDILLGIRSLAQAQTMLRNAKKYSIRAQASKCALGGLAEFLRVDYAEGIGAQYVTRAIATLVHARIESKEPKSIISEMEANETRLGELVLRVPHLQNLAVRLRNSFNKFRYDRDNVSQEARSYLDLFAGTPTMYGGFSKHQPTQESYKFEVGYKLKPNLPNSSAGRGGSSPQDLKRLKFPGVSDYASYLAASLHAPERTKEFARRIKRTVTEAAQYLEPCLQIRPLTAFESARLFAFKGKLKTSPYSKTISRAKMVGFDVETAMALLKDTFWGIIIKTSTNKRALLDILL